MLIRFVPRNSVAPVEHEKVVLLEFPCGHEAKTFLLTADKLLFKAFLVFFKVNTLDKFLDLFACSTCSEKSNSHDFVVGFFVYIICFPSEQIMNRAKINLILTQSSNLYNFQTCYILFKITKYNLVIKMEKL